MRNRYRDFCSGSPETVKAVQQASRVYLPFVALGELRAGFACGSKARENEANLTKFLGKNCVDVIYPDEETTHHYANLFRQLRQQGDTYSD